MSEVPLYLLKPHNLASAGALRAQTPRVAFLDIFACQAHSGAHSGVVSKDKQRPWLMYSVH